MNARYKVGDVILWALKPLAHYRITGFSTSNTLSGKDNSLYEVVVIKVFDTERATLHKPEKLFLDMADDEFFYKKVGDV